MSATTTCNNPKCTCDPCTCVDCRCGVARLGQLERQVMDVLWDAAGSPLTARAVADKLPAFAYTTVATVLNRLSRKGQVRRSAAGRLVLYSAIGTAGAHAAQAMREALDAASDPGDALVHFVAGMPPDQLRQLREALSP